VALYAIDGAVAPHPRLRDVAAIVGVGTTDYPDGYAPKSVPASARQYSGDADLAAIAFERALHDSGIERGEIDGLSISMRGGDPSTTTECLAATFGVKPTYVHRSGTMMAGVVPRAIEAIARSDCTTVALVYAGTRRLAGATFGGSESTTGPATYYYFHPWGWSSQIAHWALMFKRYQVLYGATEAQLGAIAVTLRSNAVLNDNAIMRAPITISDYLAARYIVTPLRLLDACLVNDGGACIVLRRSDLSEGLAHVAVHVTGWGDAEVKFSKLDYMVKQRLRPQFQEAGDAALTMAGISHDEIDLFLGYDSSTVQLLNQIEGYGFVPQGTCLQQWGLGHMERDGRLPVNTSGGMLSEAFMHGWSHVIEAVYQLRHEAGARQVADANIAMSSFATSESAHPLILKRGK
jgi:acetyl-CoA acetyltransferase